MIRFISKLTHRYESTISANIMSKVTDYYDEHMLLHPLWLGSLLLFSVIIIIGISCFIRKKFGKSIQNLYNKLCCKSGSNTSKYTILKFSYD